jgi:chromosomal replication initiation ATPase DnaA
MTQPCMCCKGTGILQTPEYSKDRADVIVAHVCSMLRVNKTAIMGQRKTADIAWARHVCFWLTRKLTSGSYPEIADYFQRKDHVTIMHGVRRVDNVRDTRPNSWETRDTTNLRNLLQKLFTPEPTIVPLDKAS